MRFPLFIELKGNRCLVVGGGKVAVRKALALVGFGAEVRVVAPKIAEDLLGCSCLSTERRCFVDSDVEGMALVVAATDDDEVNAQVAEACNRNGVLVNVVDDPARCSFFFPAIFRKDPIVAAVSSNGCSPVAASMIRDRIAGFVDDEFADAVRRLGDNREALKERFPDANLRKLAQEEALARWKE